jgi:hypothetical protein
MCTRLQFQNCRTIPARAQAVNDISSIFELSGTPATGEVQDGIRLPTGRGSVARPTKRSYCQTIVLYPGLSMILASVRRGGNRLTGFRRAAGAP